jgi:GTPase
VKFIDEVLITVESGAGGPGAVSFRREKFVPRGGPDGGDGGLGGSVIFQGSTSLSTLIDLKYKPLIRAEKGMPGAGRLKIGRSGVNLIVKVPFGTEVHLVSPYHGPAGSKEAETQSSHATVHQLISDIEKDDVEQETDLLDPESKTAKSQSSNSSSVNTPILHDKNSKKFPRFFSDITPQKPTITVARGGRGGKGNDFFKSATRRAPDFAQPGERGEAFQIRLSLKLMADVGLIGYPNAGKSSLLGRISAAKPAVGAYPFTTLSPSLGVVRLGEGSHFVAADIPGLVEGAHTGKGLGVRFLKHIERTRALLHIVDGEFLTSDSQYDFEGNEEASSVASTLPDTESAEEISFHKSALHARNRIIAIQHELSQFSERLHKLPQIVAISKSDLLIDPSLRNFIQEKLSSEFGKILFFSSVTGEGIEELLSATWELVKSQTLTPENAPFIEQEASSLDEHHLDIFT